ncbi:Serine-protein kinase ATM [Holothuria leucospilota]|uniref:Serine-protein kinase ATM n=1 Tax=Holothuria leucospilota TaxID=206669 RepID=A0A9Q1BGS8_HOLLE|nr:Serine-protein kinase ATM [Holothuria leucospilota]
MSESLLKLRACCGQLASDKVSERKKQIDIFKRELGKPSVCRQLDQNSQNRRGMIWEHCFEAVREFMVKEVEHVKSKQGKGSFDHRKLLSTGSIFKWFVQKANNNGEYLDITVLVEHILYLVRDEIGLLCYGMECCMVVNKELLGSWKYRCRMTSKSWQDFLKYFCKCLLNSPKKMSLDLLANLVQQLFAGAVHHANIRKGLFFSFFKQIIETFR